MNNTYFFYAQRTGKLFSNFHQSPLYFKMFAQTDPVKVQITVLNDSDVPTHFGWKNHDGKIEFIHQHQDDVKRQIKDGFDILESKGMGRIVKLNVSEYTSY